MNEKENIAISIASSLGRDAVRAYKRCDEFEYEGVKCRWVKNWPVNIIHQEEIGSKKVNRDVSKVNERLIRLTEKIRFGSVGGECRECGALMITSENQSAKRSESQCLNAACGHAELKVKSGDNTITMNYRTGRGSIED